LIGANISGSSYQGLQAGGQFLQAEWFCQIVISPTVQADLFVINRRSPGEHDYRRGVLSPSQSRAYVYATDIRQIKIKDNGIVSTDGQKIKGRPAIRGSIYRMILLGQKTSNDCGQFDIVIYN
jgi:hypothetical protein